MFLIISPRLLSLCIECAKTEKQQQRQQQQQILATLFDTRKWNSETHNETLGKAFASLLLLKTRPLYSLK